jgi:hypothetical protein
MLNRVYEYRILRGDVELQIQEKHAKNDVQLEKYVEAVILPKYPHSTAWTYKQLYCDCGEGNNDVTAYWVKKDGKEVREVKCYSCRLEKAINRKVKSNS